MPGTCLAHYAVSTLSYGTSCPWPNNFFSNWKSVHVTQQAVSNARWRRVGAGRRCRESWWSSPGPVVAFGLYGIPSNRRDHGPPSFTRRGWPSNGPDHFGIASHENIKTKNGKCGCVWFITGIFHLWSSSYLPGQISWWAFAQPVQGEASPVVEFSQTWRNEFYRV